MASIIVNRGLQQIGERVSNATSAPAIQTLAVDDRTTAFVAGDTNLGGPANMADVTFDSTPTRTGQTVRHVATIPSATVINIKRVSLHNETPLNVSGTSVTLIGGIDGQSFNKPAGFGLRITVDIAYSSV